MPSVITDNTSGTGMVGGGRFYSVQTNVAAAVVKNSPGRLFRVIVTAGTGTITCYDNASAASGNVLWTKTAVAVGDIYAVDCPATNGITVAVAAATTANFIYS